MFHILHKGRTQRGKGGRRRLRLPPSYEVVGPQLTARGRGGGKGCRQQAALAGRQIFLFPFGKGNIEQTYYLSFL